MTTDDGRAHAKRGLLTLSTGAGKTHAGLFILKRLLRPRSSQFAAGDERLWPIGSIGAQQTVLTQGTAPLTSEIPYQPRRLRALTKQQRYAKAMRQAEAWEREGRDEQRVPLSGDRRVRNPHVRRGVIDRSNGRCENPYCRDPQPLGRTDADLPILEVDHVDDHATGGRDHGSNAIALCPNCHALKTRGHNRERMRHMLARTAQQLDRAAKQ